MTKNMHRSRRTIRAGAIGWLALAGLAFLLPGPATGQDGLALKRVTLSSGGVGYFEYETDIDGNGEVSLPVRLDQVDDVLKSLVIRDSKGVAATLRLAGREPLGQIFGNLPIGQSALESPAKLLLALKGSEITIGGRRNLRGRIVAVVPEITRLPNGLGETTRHRVSLLTSTGIQNFILEDSQSVRFTDPKIVEAVETGLAAIEENRAQDKRVLRVSSSGTGKRALSAGYVVQVPVWKTTYRLALPGPDQTDDAKVRLEGWAILENMSAEDWNDVELTLVSGNPVTFRQSLYPAYYVNRPEVPVAVVGRLLPRADQGSVAADADAKSEETRKSNLRFRMPETRSAMGMNRAMSAAGDMIERSATAAPAPGEPARQNAIAEDAATQVMFRLPRPVSVKTGHSLSVRFLNRDIPAERLSLYQPGTHARHPLASVRIANEAGSGLPPGALTFFENGANGALSYVGDAQLKALPVGESRILSYALDNRTTIDRETSNSQSILKGKISRGLLEVVRLSQVTTSYRMKLSAPEGRSLIIEQPRMAGWELTKPDIKAVTLTPGFYRIPVELKRSAADKLDVVLQRPRSRSYRLTSLSRADALVYAGTEGFDPPMRQAFSTLAGLKRDIEEKEQALDRLAEERKRWADDQARLRDNLSKVPRNSDLHQDYLKRLTSHEEKIESAMGKIDGARTALDKAKTALANFVQNLEL